MGDLIEKCQVCRALLDEEDLFCANCGASSPHESVRTRPEPVRLAYHFQCRQCGASMSYDARVQTLRCPFCGSQQLVERKDTRVWSPKRVVPFVLDQSQAMRSLRQWLGRGFWRPSDLARAADVAKMAPVYVPYWLFSAETHTYWTADIPAPPRARGDWRPTTGEFRGRYAGVLVGGSAALTPSETEALCPYDMADAVEWSEADLRDVNVEPCTVPRKYARPMAKFGLEAMERNLIAREQIGQKHRNLKLNMRVENLTSEPVLLPVWISAYRYRGRLFRFLVNGQTGKATGEAPISKLKVALAIGLLIFLGLAGLLIALANQ